ncbi:MAG: hypothetical protein NT178_09815 [Proteobacteria bacterium]|nr:hypothetical protein [Pseudomonadota bacterium]
MEPIEFEKLHSMFDGMMFDLCVECGGGCEKNTITYFLPGEAEFVSRKLEIPFMNFIDRFCNTFPYKGHKIYGLVGDCHFLDITEGRCRLETRNAKLMLCLAYPAMIGYPGDIRKIFIDDIDCSMAHRVSDEFKKKAFEVLELALEHLPDWWLEFNLEHGWPIYDYELLAALKGRKEISIEELRACAIVRGTEGEQ